MFAAASVAEALRPYPLISHRRGNFTAIDPLPPRDIFRRSAPMAELVDAPDSKSGGGDIVLVRVRLGAPVDFIINGRSRPNCTKILAYDACRPHADSKRQAGAGLKSEHRFSPAPHQIAVEEFEHGLFLRDRLIAGDDSGDDHIATVVEGERQHRFRRWSADRIAAAAAFHPMHRDGPAGAECRTFAADEIDVADAIEFLVVGHSGLTIAEAD